MKKAIIIGATSGIGRELALQMDKAGYTLGLTGRRTDMLVSLQDDLSRPSFMAGMDIARFDEARQVFDDLAGKMGVVDVVVINSGVGHPNTPFDWELDKETIDVNVTGFAAIAQAAFQFFRKQGHGHLVGVSSVASQAPSARAAAYCASKAFISNYMQGIRAKGKRLKFDLSVTDVRPGYVITPMTHGNKHMFWEVDVTYATRQILRAIEKKKQRVYVPRRWWIIHFLLQLLPYRAMNRS